MSGPGKLQPAGTESTENNRADDTAADELPAAVAHLVDVIRKRYTANGALDLLIVLEDHGRERHWPMAVLDAIREIRGAVESQIWERPQ